MDLTATPKQIMSDFSHWLTEYKRKTGYEQERYFTKLHLSRLVQHRVLQYIDLMLVAKVEGREIDPKKATKVIYAGKKHVPDGKLKRTTEDWAKWLMRKETLFAIKAQLDETLYQS